MVLFDGPILPGWKSALEEEGATVRAYLPKNALLVEAPESAMAAIRRMPQIAWVGEYLPSHKVQPLLATIAQQQPLLLVPVTLQTFSPDDVAGVELALSNQGASSIQATAAKRWGLVRAVLAAGAATELANLPEIQWIEHREPSRLLNNVARSAGHLNSDVAAVEHGLDGTGQIVSIADTGLDTGNPVTLHPDFAGRLLHVFDIGRLTNWSDTYYHGTHVAASVLGTGAASGGQYRGVAPGAQLVFQSVMDAAGALALPEDLNDLYRPPRDLGARIHSDSWGSAVFGEYTSDSMTTDEFVWDHPDMLIAFAAGNEGVDYDRDGIVDAASLDAPASAKNVLAVGASECGRPPGTGGKTSVSYGTAWPYDYRVPPISTDLISSSPSGEPQGIAAYSSRGPAHDGRAKPDVVAPGTDIVSARSRATANTGWGVAFDNTNYCFMGGTSMATPLAAGSATLIRQYCVDVLGMDNPSAALLKAAMLGGARSLSPGQYGSGAFREIPAAPRPNSVEGWGQVDVGNTLFPTNGSSAVFREGPVALHSGETNSLRFLVFGNSPLTVAMAYSDYPSALSAAVNLVNDLDLSLVDPDGNVLHPNGRSAPDDRNNVEGIDDPSPTPGLWTAVVSGRNVPEGPQPFALYLRGAIQMPIQIDHVPLVNTILTNQEYLVAADLACEGFFDTNAVRLVWIASGSPGGFVSLPMSSADGRRFVASIPSHPVGTRIWYYVAAGPDDFTSHHPSNAPLELHSFSVTPPISLEVSGSPGNLLSADPPYGTHALASNLAIRARAIFPPLGNNGWRTACIGWTGTGSIPPSGSLDFCDFTLVRDSSIVWLWQEQVELTQVSSPYGAITLSSWVPRNGIASSATAPETHVFNDAPLTFAGWTVDGIRYPPGNSPSPRQISGIQMASPRSASATYLPSDGDEDSSGLPDWFEMRHFGQLDQNRYADPDGDGYENELEAADHTDPLDPHSFPEPPAIQHDYLPSVVHFPAPWAVSAIATDNFRVDSVWLHWQRNGGVWRSVAMGNDVGTNRFSALIPSPARDGDIVAYRISASDSAGFYSETTAHTVSVSYARMVVSPDAIEASARNNSSTNQNLFVWNTGSQPLHVSIDLVAVGFRDDVESGTNGWTRPDGATDWIISPHRSHSPSRAWYCGMEPMQSYSNSTHASLLSPPIQLGARSPRLDFMHWARFEPDTDRIADAIHYWDSGVLEITDNAGRTWQSLVPDGGYPGLITSNPASPFAPETPCFADTEDWEPVGVDLSPYAGREVQIRFRFGADRYVVAEGWRIDDVVVTPHGEYDGWISLPPTNAVIPAGLGAIFPLALDTAPLPPMSAGHVAVRILHDDPERDDPVVVPVSLFNTTRRVRVSTDGNGQADPDGETLVQEDSPFSLLLAAAPGSFIADVQTNSVPAPLPSVVATQSLHWTSLDGNLDVRATFAQRLAEGSVSLAWLAGYGLTNRNWMAEASLDQDADGLLAWQEEQLGSSPIDPGDAPLAVTLLAPAPPDDKWRVAWHAFTNRSATYSILSAPSPTAEFTAFTNLPPTPPVMTSPPLPAAHSFFGIRKTSP